MCQRGLPVRIPLTGNVACAKKLGSENMSSSLTTKRRKVSSGSWTVKVASGGAGHTGFSPLSSGVHATHQDTKREKQRGQINSTHTGTYQLKQTVETHIHSGH